MSTLAADLASAQVVSLDRSSASVLAGACECGALGSYTITEGDLLVRDSLDLLVNPLFPCASSLPTCSPALGPGTPRTLIWDVDPAGAVPGTYFTLGLVGVNGCHGDGSICTAPPPEGCQVEVDAFSGGLSGLGGQPFAPSRIKFSVDRLSTGADVMSAITGVQYACVPTVYSEAPSQEAHGDVFVSARALPGVPPFADPWQMVPLGNVGVADGEGCRNAASAFQYPGMGLMEPALAPPDGDDVDALEVEELDIGTEESCPVWFSLDRASAVANRAHLGILDLGPADILRANVQTGTVTRAFTAADLGLDTEVDDVDALSVGFPGDDRCEVPAAANPVGVVFSVTRDSGVVGQPDSRYGVPIQPGDILRMPAAPGLKPEIYIPAELLGLVASRGQVGVVPDDLDALAFNWNGAASILDCNGNGVEDAVDIARGSEDDCDANGIPDSCEISMMPGLDADVDGVLDQCQGSHPEQTADCFGNFLTGMPCPCGNESPPTTAEGCTNSTGSGAILSAYGSRWAANQECLLPVGPGPGNLSRLVLTATQLPPNQVCTFFQGDAWENNGSGSLFGSDGLLCVAVANGIKIQVVTSDAAGTASTTVDIASIGLVQVGATKYYQARFRDDTTWVCGTGQNTSNGLRILWDPSN